jgi:membrane associated rhomboid family serine protease
MFVCPTCGGRAVAVSVLRRALGQQFVRRLWSRAKTLNQGAGKKCPACSRAMCDVVADTAQGGAHLDVCTRCPLVWFDAREFEEPPAPPKPARGSLPLEAREAIAMAELRLDDERRRGPDLLPEGAPRESWKWIPAYFGLPVEEDPGFAAAPIVTWGQAAILVLTFALTWSNLADVIQHYSLIPADPWRHGGLTWLTSFFIHAGLMHLVVNVYFLLLCGDNVEDDLGHLRFAGLILAAALVGDAAHILADSRPGVPCVGASGGIAGILTYYALRFPRVRVSMLLRYWIIPIGWYYVPAYFALFGWLALQIMTPLLDTQGVGSVSGAALVGGASVGLAAWAWRTLAHPEISAE